MRFWRRSRDHDPLVCREFVELVTDYIEGAITDHERARFEAHLADCDGCAGYLDDVRRMVETLRDLPPVPPDEETREALTRAFNELRGSS